MLAAVVAVLILGSEAALAAFELQSGMIIDTETGRAYVMSPGGGSEALDLESGEVLWHNDAAGRPLALVNGQLTAQAERSEPGTLEVIVLDAALGSLSGSSVLDLPEGVVAHVAQQLGVSFQIWAQVQGNEVLIGWSESRRVISGIGSGEPTTVSAGARLDVRTAALTPVTNAPAIAVRVETELGAAQQLDDVEGRQFRSSDGEHILVSEAIPDRWAYRWSLYTTSGDLVGNITHQNSYRPFFLHGTQLIYQSQGSYREVRGRITSDSELRAIDLNTGQQIWSRPVRDTRYHGPYPP